MPNPSTVALELQFRQFRRKQHNATKAQNFSACTGGGLESYACSRRDFPKSNLWWRGSKSACGRASGHADGDAVSLGAIE